MKSAKVSSKGQIVIPKEVREKLGLKQGDEVVLESVSTADSKRLPMAILLPKPKDWAKTMRGLGAEIWKDTNTDEYLKEERGSWD
ncbi:MAG: AbrB/MazE/SpoVT family DNA-binding domain-containing protein [Actinobacteria bacterium]|nr:AbrB/MazE/SpoVT family DNA-binding domain-containing protein [Actinomycetota bacterium]MCG2818628.1 AbrB/MazE/SpoVT family DNA-binding domain-containing protein [Actinomycetes bacterium]MBU4218183.1 AbrB/MazE/SpoVT family DNA-binding domain-containing protein [Actinomycetota bacterium]MBU4358608.1 AbrB/MazE/SpoVT family DNA-binding domain-containing protein [Actinomycetota bacterium]MBU4392077.1 AbrB/MazE/SpoVT family DNA-binding domain-containing protein [Actinomycetota bacterium]